MARAGEQDVHDHSQALGTNVSAGIRRSSGLYLPTLAKGLTRNLDCANSLASSSLLLFLSSLSNSASMNFIHFCNFASFSRINQK